jgi:hypothetical protein
MKTQNKGILYRGCNIHDDKLSIFLSYILISGGVGGIHIQTNFLLYVNQTFELNIFPNRHHLDDQQV